MRIVLFDIDGTLINSAGAGRRAMERAIAELYGIKNAMDGVQLHGRADPVIVRDAFKQALGRSPTQTETEAVIDRLVANLPTELANSPKYRVLPGVLEILEELGQRDDVLLGLETGNTEPAAELKLSHGGIWKYFRCGGYGSDSAVRSEIVQTGIDRAKRLLDTGDEIEEIWVVGDTPVDVNAGKAVGARTLATATGMHGLDLLRAEEPDLAVADLSNAPLVIETLLGDRQQSGR